MQQVQCPHCRNVLVDDGQLAGQLVACPHCGGQFQLSGWAQEPPIHIAVPSAAMSLPSTYHSKGRKPVRKKDQSVLIMVGLLALVVVAGIGMAFALMQRTDVTQIAAQPSSTQKVSQLRATSKKSEPMNRETQRTSSATQQADAERRQREIEHLREETRLANENAKRRIDDEVRRQLDDKRKQREARLAALSQREKNEIPPIEAEIQELRAKLASSDRKVAQLRSQIQSLPQSSGIPAGTRFQPTIPRETRDLERKGIQRSQQLQDSFAEFRSELVTKLQNAERRLEQKEDEFEREREKILTEL